MKHNIVLKECCGLEIENKNFPIKTGFIESLNDKGINHLDIYCIVEDINVNEERKIKIRITGSKDFTFSDIDDEEWEEHCTK